MREGYSNSLSVGGNSGLACLSTNNVLEKSFHIRFRLSVVTIRIFRHGTSLVLASRLFLRYVFIFSRLKNDFCKKARFCNVTKNGKKKTLTM